MTIIHSPGIINDSIKFYIDMFNTNKSYAGAPTTNLAVNPNDFSQATWGKALVNITAGPTEETLKTLTTTDPRVWKMTESSTVSGVRNVTQNTDPVSIGDVYSISVCAKAIDRNYMYITMFGEFQTVFDLSLGTIVLTGDRPATITSLGNGWYLCTATFTKTNTTAGFFIGILDSSNAANITYTGVTGRGIYISRAQYEVGNPTPYVNGSRTSAANIYDLVTRTAGAAGNLVYAGDTYSFNNTTSYINFGNNTNYQQASAITMEAWIKPSAIALGTAGNIMTKNDNSAYRFRHLHDGGTSNGIEFLVNGAGNSLRSPSNVLTLDAWNHVSVTGDTSGLKIYINGVLVASNATAFAPSVPTSGNLYVGAFNEFATEVFNGQIGTASMHSRALTSDEIVGNFNALKGRFGL